MLVHVSPLPLEPLICPVYTVDTVSRVVFTEKVFHYIYPLRLVGAADPSERLV